MPAAARRLLAVGLLGAGLALQACAPATDAVAAKPQAPARSAAGASTPPQPQAASAAEASSELSVAPVAAASASTTASGPVTVRDDRGRSLTLPAPPQRIVSLMPSLTEALCALGGCDRLVGTDQWSNWPASVLALPKLGGLDDVALEAVLRLKPDVVLLSRAHRVAARLEALGIPTLAFASDTHADVQRSLRALGQLLGTPERGDAAWAQVAQQLRRAADRVPQPLRGQAVFIEIGSGPYAAGPGSFLGQTLQAMGLANIVPADFGPFPKLNPEFVLREQPRVLIGSVTAAGEWPQRPGWNALQALRGRQWCALPSSQWDVLVRPGPRLGEAATLLADCLAALPPAEAPAAATGTVKPAAATARAAHGLGIRSH